MTKGYKTAKVEFVGAMGGYLWMPACPAWKAVYHRIRRDNAPFALDWTGDFRSLLESVDMKEGCDFQRCRFMDAQLKITRRRAVAGGYAERVRYVNLNTPATSDYFWSEDESHVFMQGADDEEAAA